jgi:hypothetical protein
VEFLPFAVPVLSLVFSAFVLGTEYGRKWERWDRFDREASRGTDAKTD